MLVKDIEKAVQQSAIDGWGYGGMALSNRALTHLCRHMSADNQFYQILELGGGQSTLFWREIIALKLLSISVMTLEHHEEWAVLLTKKIDPCDGVTIYPQTLKQISEQEWKEVFQNPSGILEVWDTFGKEVSKQDYDLYTIRNSFYAELGTLPLKENSVDVMIVDGPHGNGRSLAYPLFSNYLKPDALLLIDDFDHYPFLFDLGRVFSYEELYREILGQERWVLVQLTGRR